MERSFIIVVSVFAKDKTF